jgi:glucosamine-6-phosphate deaminase
MVKHLTIDRLRVEIHPDRSSSGRAAGHAAAEFLRQSLADAPPASPRLLLAAAPSQNEMLQTLVRETLAFDWSRVDIFHMDEYLGLAPDHPASFRRYLRERILDRLPLSHDRIHLIPGESADEPLAICLNYERLLKQSPIDLVCAGIGENGHLAFNDPPVADFHDPVGMKVVRLDEACRAQQVHDGCFPSLDAVPRHAYTLTIPRLLSARSLVVTVPGLRKAQAVRDALLGPIAEACPASILRTHPNATLYLDREAASLCSFLA